MSAKAWLRINQNDPWVIVPAHKFTDEKEFQQLLGSLPDPLEAADTQGPRFALTAREFGLPGSGRSDIIGVAADGSILIGEAKLAQSSEIKRRVIGQILEYAAYLNGFDYDEFERRIQARLGTSDPLEVLIRARAPDDTSEEANWSAIEFTSAVRRNLRDGNFTLAIFVDRMNDGLLRTIQYMNAKGEDRLRVFAYEITKYRFGSSGELVIPTVYGVESAKAAARSRPAGDYSKLLEDSSPEAQDLDARLRQWAVANDLIAEPTVQGKSLRLVHDGVPILRFYPAKNRVRLRLQVIQKAGLEVEAARIRADIQRIFGLGYVPLSKPRVPGEVFLAEWKRFEDEFAPGYLAAVRKAAAGVPADEDDEAEQEYQPMRSSDWLRVWAGT